MKKSWLIVLFILLTAFQATTAQENEIFLKGYLQNILTDKIEYQAGETIVIDLLIKNDEEFLIHKGYIVAELVYGKNQPYYPSHGVQENIIREVYKRDISILPKQKSVQKVYLEIPRWTVPGSYRVDLFFKDQRTNIVGIPYIFVPGKWVNINITNSGEIKNVQIIRDGTHIENVPGPVGPHTDKDIVSGTVAIKNFGNHMESNLKLVVVIAPWDDTEDIKDEKREYTFDIPVLNPGEQMRVDFQFPNPTKPYAYAVRLEIRDVTDQLLSLYRLRLVRKGVGSRIQTLLIDRPKLIAGERAKTHLRIIGPSDGINSLDGKIKIEALSKVGNLIYTEEIPVKLSPDNPYLIKNLSFIPSITASSFIISAKVYSGGQELERYSVEIDGDEYKNPPNEISLKTCLDKACGQPSDTFNNKMPMYIHVEILDKNKQPADCRLLIKFSDSEKKINVLILDEEVLGLITEKYTPIVKKPEKYKISATCWDSNVASEKIVKITEIPRWKEPVPKEKDWLPKFLLIFGCILIVIIVLGVFAWKKL